MNTPAQTIEAILFATAEPQTVRELTTLLDKSEAEVEQALIELENNLHDRGIMLVKQGGSVTLATRPEHAPLLEQIRKETLARELSKASAETLAVVVYHPGATKAEIELIRGVNSSYSLRSLQIRGLIEQKGSGRTISYQPTIELLESFGASSIENLPQYLETKQKIDTLLSNQSSL